jgi:hypothetical protein
LAACAKGPVKFSPGDIHKFEAQLKEISEKRIDGKFADDEGNVLQGSDKVSALLERCQLYTSVILDRFVPSVILCYVLANWAGQAWQVSREVEADLRCPRWN